MKPARLEVMGSLTAAAFLAALGGCGQDRTPDPASKIDRDEAQALAEAESMLAEQRMPHPAGEEENARGPAGDAALPDTAASERP